MNIKGLPKAVKSVEELLENISKMLDSLDPDISETKDEMYNDAYMEIDSALESLISVRKLNLKSY